MSKNLKFDGGFTYIWIQDASISQNAGSTTSNGLVSGNYKANVTIFGISGTYSF